MSSESMEAAREADWQQVVLNGGPPCFHMEEHGRFCLRAERWGGHDTGHFHNFVSLAALLEDYASKMVGPEVQRTVAKAVAAERERAVKSVRDQLHPDVVEGDECCCPFCNDICEWIVTDIRKATP